VRYCSQFAGPPTVIKDLTSSSGHLCSRSRDGGLTRKPTKLVEIAWAGRIVSGNKVRARLSAYRRPFAGAQGPWRLELVTFSRRGRRFAEGLREIDRGFATLGGAGQALTRLVPGGPVRTVGTYSSSWVRPSKVRLLIMLRATSG
jgi:hypothetical protein